RPGARGPRPRKPPASADAAGTSLERGMSHAAGTPAPHGGADVKKVGSTWVGGPHGRAGGNADPGVSARPRLAPVIPERPAAAGCTGEYSLVGGDTPECCRW